MIPAFFRLYVMWDCPFYSGSITILQGTLCAAFWDQGAFHPMQAPHLTSVELEAHDGQCAERVHAHVALERNRTRSLFFICSDMRSSFTLSCNRVFFPSATSVIILQYPNERLVSFPMLPSPTLMESLPALSCSSLSQQ